MITIVITYYNLKYFSEALLSLAHQTNKDFKVFVGNDQSPEDPLDVINDFKEVLDLTYIKFDNNFGGKDLTKQWLRCLDYVTTDWFLILGDDDLLSENAIEEFYKTLKIAPGFNVFRYSIKRIDGHGEPTTEVITYKDKEKSTDFFVKKANLQVLSSLGEYVFNTEKIKNTGIVSYPKAFYSDDMMVLKASDFGPIKNITKGVALIRVSESSFSGNKSYNIESVKASVNYYCDLIKEYKDYFSEKDIESFLPYLIRTAFRYPNIVSKKKVFGILYNLNKIGFIPKYGFKILKNKLRK